MQHESKHIEAPPLMLTTHYSLLICRTFAPDIVANATLAVAIIALVHAQKLCAGQLCSTRSTDDPETRSSH